MIGINLIPPPIMEGQRRARHLRRWGLALTLAAIVTAIPISWQIHQESVANRLRRKNADLAIRIASARIELADVIGEFDQLVEQIERANALRTKRSWASFLAMISQEMPSEVWLTTMATETPQAPSRPAGRPPASKDEPTQGLTVLAGARAFMLDGYAIDHDDLYEFMARLKASGAFDYVELVRAERQDVLRSRAVHFELTCTW